MGAKGGGKLNFSCLLPLFLSLQKLSSPPSHSLLLLFFFSLFSFPSRFFFSCPSSLPLFIFLLLCFSPSLSSHLLATKITSVAREPHGEVHFSHPRVFSLLSFPGDENYFRRQGTAGRSLFSLPCTSFSLVTSLVTEIISVSRVVLSLACPSPCGFDLHLPLF